MGNRHSTGLVIVVWALSALPGLAVPAQGGSPSADLDAIERAFVELAERVSPSVVVIETEWTVPQPPRPQDLLASPMVGSGVVIDAGGLILTNNHVVRSGDRIYVVLHTGHRCEAHIVGRDERSDLAVLRVESDALTAAVQGDLGEVAVGQFAFAMGNPFGSARDGRSSFTFGVVSALGKSLRSLEDGGRRYYGNLIQTTAEIYPGNSGGPLFDIRGRLIGVNTAIETGSEDAEHLGYAIPLARTKDIIRRLARGERVRYGFLGVRIGNASGEARRRSGAAGVQGVMVDQVIQDSPAASANLRQRDLIVRYGSEPVRDTDHFIRMVGATPVGETVSMVVYRGRREMQVRATLAERPLAVAARP